MRNYSLACALILHSLVPCSSHGQGLEGLNAVHVVIEDVEKAGTDIGLFPEALQFQILVGLKRDLPRLKITPRSLSMVYLSLTVVGDPNTGVSVYVTTQLKRPAQIVRDDNSEGKFTLATVWNKGYLLSGPGYGMASRVREVISNQMTEFAADYYKQNQP